ncbi:alpha-2-macroglobulin receptor-associated protein isoform X2 [Tachyglossus aculeatus]|uniref:alpha-2-macroglobulin receptor-associated protein isoform X2 n=1 Tax=Tachyglossus aculeatus TaxID=9261 RepID=UPI0018F57C9E|nr:alpha-2-macroglobulin receptor-associated protein isoform X2 [Tachyglossus aculeatus]
MSAVRVWALAGLLWLLCGKSSPEPNEFRLLRLQQAWEKAQRLHLSAVKLAELHSDLKIQEKDEFTWKKLKADGLDEDGEKEARLRRSFHVILMRYGLDGKKNAQLTDTNFIEGGSDSEVLDDPRLEKLWNKAKTSGKFSSEELDKLWREFKHHKEKVEEYNMLLETVSRTEEFEEPRVIDLWDQAQTANFTKKELESFREELKHFEAKIEKHHHYQKQLEISQEKLRHLAGAGDKEHLSHNKEKYALLEEKTKALGYKVKKHLQDLSSRISRGLQHNEL